MTILKSEIKFFKSMVVSDASNNGGHRSDNQITSGSSQNIWPNIYSAERNAGSTKHRFVYICNHNANKETAFNVKIWLDSDSTAGDYISFFQASQGMTQGDITGSEEKYACLVLATNIPIGGNTFVGNVANAALASSFLDGDTFRISDKADPEAVSGNEEYVTISGSPVVSGTQVTITFTPVTANAYTVAAGTRGAKVLELSEVVADFGTIIKSSAAGTFDDVNYPPQMDNIGTVQDILTFTFSNATQFTCVSTRYGSLGAGDISTQFAPNNPRCSRPYITIPVGFFTGTWAQNDTLTIPTLDASVNICEKRVLPAGTSPFTNNSFNIGVSLES